MKKFNGKKIMALVTALGICAAPFSASAADGCFAKQMLENMLKNREIPCISDIVSESGEGANGEKYEILSEKLKAAAGELDSYIKCGSAQNNLNDCIKQLLNNESGTDNGDCNQTPAPPAQEQKPEQPETPVIPEIPTENPEENPQDTQEKEETEDLPTVEVPSDKPGTSAPTPDENSSGEENAGTQTQLSGYAYEIVSLVNQHRASAGLSPLKYDDSSLMEAAQTRAQEQQTLYSHTRPDGSSCFTVLDQFGISCLRAGENIAMGQRSAAEVVEDWMNSAGHRENIMNPDFTHIGVGVHQGGGTCYWSQMFIAKK